MCDKHKLRRGENGAIIIVVVWAVILLAGFAVAIASYVASSIKLAEDARDRVQAYASALAGVEYAAMEVAADTNSWDSFDEGWGNVDRKFIKIAIGNGSYSVVHKAIKESGSTITNAGVVDEESKININKADAKLLSSMLVTICNLDEASAGQIASSIIDWRDSDDELLTGGAETAYYQSLSRQMAAHNDDFQSVNELTLVKGVTAEIFKKISAYVTVYGSGKVNINTADEKVLLSVAIAAVGGNFPAAGSLASKIVAFRNGGNAINEANAAVFALRMKDSMGLKGEEEAILSGMIPYITIKGTCFGGESIGRSDNGVKEIHVSFVYDRDERRIRYWNEK